MIFDSEEQRKRILDLIGEVPVQTNIAGVMSGPSQEIMALVTAIEQGLVMSPSQQKAMVLEDWDGDGDG